MKKNMQSGRRPHRKDIITKNQNFFDKDKYS